MFPKGLAKFWNKKKQTNQDTNPSLDGSSEQEPNPPEEAKSVVEQDNSELSCEIEQVIEQQTVDLEQVVEPEQEVQDLEKEQQESSQTDSLEDLLPPAPPILDFKISSNNMRAVMEITLNAPGQTVTPDEILNFIKAKKITYGILEDEIRGFCAKADFSQQLVCAVGKQAIDENDGRIEYHFDTDKALHPIQRKDGSLDYRELGLVKSISKGDTLCTLLPSRTGSDGMDIFGKVVPCRKGAVPNLPVGVNTVISEDGLILSSTVDGSIEILPNAINVNEIFIVKGDVGRESGNVSAKCSVLIQGDVRSGYSVSAGGDITVRGIVEHAHLEAGGNIVISQGMNGGGRGSLKAGGNISGKFFENAILDAKHDIYASIIMSSLVHAGGSLILNKDLATLAGGECNVGYGIYAKNIGNNSGSVTRLRIESRELTSLLTQTSKKLKNPEVLLEELEKARQELQAFEDNYERLHQQFVQQHPADDGTGFEQVRLAAEKKRIVFSKKIEELQVQYEQSQESLKSFLSYSVIAKGMVYPGVKMEIGGYTYNVIKETSCAKFHLSYGKVEWRPATPTDTPDTVKR